MYLKKIPKNGSIYIEIKDGVIISSNITDNDLEAKIESKVNEAVEKINPQCLQCKNLAFSCAGYLKEPFTCTHFSLDKENTIERIKLFYRNGSN